MISKVIRKILIANRGEIALRIIRTCRSMGISSVAVYSDIEIHAPHVLAADEAFSLGAPDLTESYLNTDKILRIARQANVDAIHPGYGFLSENPVFAQAVLEAGFIFIGPSPDAMRKLGQKTSARQLVGSIGIPFVPGTLKEIKDEIEGANLAQGIGFPVLLKAAGGGGGKGMRVVKSEPEFAELFRIAQSESQSAFGDGRIYIEKYLRNPRHVEVQILADNHGNAVHLGERECSIQRRHQKLIEESPSPVIDSGLLEKLSQAALDVVEKAGYSNAGTVEFLVDEERKFYFLEMNTRLQVEHPVTEMRTGVDIVREQIKIASGERLRYRQEEIVFRGHAIECRIYAEDPDDSFLPSTGLITHYPPSGGTGIREDRGVAEGSMVTMYYDSLLSKLIAFAPNRSEAIERMRSALTSYELYGVHSTADLCARILSHKDFEAGDYCTTFLEEKFGPRQSVKPGDNFIDLASVAAVFYKSFEHNLKTGHNRMKSSRTGWKSDRWQNELPWE